MAHQFGFPTRNEARSIIQALAKQYAAVNGGSIPKKELTTYAVLLYKANGIGSSNFVFTNALVDLFADMNVDSENYVDNSIMILNSKAKLDIEEYFLRNLSDSFSNIIENADLESNEFEVPLMSIGMDTLDRIWFNNSGQFMQPLLASYQSFKRGKGMLFQREDIKQIVVDYATVLCRNHFIQKGFLNKSMLVEIVNILTEAANNCLTTITVNSADIEYVVERDLKYPSRVNSAFNFITQL
jgi:hypothetical protein